MLFKVDLLKDVKNGSVWKYQGSEKIKLKWVYSLNLNAKGNVIWQKARLVAKKYSQNEGTDFTEVFLLKSRYILMCLIFAANVF